MSLKLHHEPNKPKLHARVYLNQAEMYNTIQLPKTNQTASQFQDQQQKHTQQHEVKNPRATQQSQNAFNKLNQ